MRRTLIFATVMTAGLLLTETLSAQQRDPLARDGAYGDRQAGTWGDPGDGVFGNPGQGYFGRSGTLPPLRPDEQRERLNEETEDSGAQDEPPPYVILETPSDRPVRRN